jgi:hypothetical protein
VKSVGIDPRFSAADILVRQGSGFGLIGRGQVLCDRMCVAAGVLPRGMSKWYLIPRISGGSQSA